MNTDRKDWRYLVASGGHSVEMGEQDAQHLLVHGWQQVD